MSSARFDVNAVCRKGFVSQLCVWRSMQSRCVCMVDNNIGVAGAQVLIPALENLGQLEQFGFGGLFIIGPSMVFVK